MTHKPLKLLARSAEDMDVLSAHIQDAVLQIGDMTFLDNQRRIVMLMNRYCWEQPESKHLRVRSALQIGGILTAPPGRCRLFFPAAAKYAWRWRLAKPYWKT